MKSHLSTIFLHKGRLRIVIESGQTGGCGRPEIRAAEVDTLLRGQCHRITLLLLKQASLSQNLGQRKKLLVENCSLYL